MEEWIRGVIVIFVLVYSCILHECAHVWVALKLGDPTGKMEGRLTLNPLPHVDLFWTILLPIIMGVSTRWRFVIGGPKPAPVNPLNFRDPRTGFMWTALAGPATNLLLAVLAIALLWALHAVVPELVQAETVRDDRGDITGYHVSWNAVFFRTVILTNVTLAVVNLIPVPPLDGSRFLQFILGRSGEDTLAWIERLGFIPIAIAFYFLAPYAVIPTLNLLEMVLARLFGSDYANALMFG